MGLALFVLFQWAGWIHVSWWWIILFTPFGNPVKITIHPKFSEEFQQRVHQKYQDRVLK